MKGVRAGRDDRSSPSLPPPLSEALMTTTLGLDRRRKVGESCGGGRVARQGGIGGVTDELRTEHPINRCVCVCV